MIQFYKHIFDRDWNHQLDLDVLNMAHYPS